jgi:cytochrome d ubiquinol oxidase subunit II
LGATWLIWRTEGNTRIFAREIARPALLGTGAAIALISIWTPIAHPAVAGRWFAWPGLAYLAPLPAIAAAAWLVAWRSLWGRAEWLPFAATILLFFAALVGLGVSIWPAAIPGVLTIEDASSSLRTQAIVATALVIIVPLILSYVGYSYWVFRGKVGPGHYDH